LAQGNTHNLFFGRGLRGFFGLLLHDAQLFCLQKQSVTQLLRCLQSQVQHSLARAYALSNLLSLNQSTVKSNRVRVCARVCVLSSPAHQQVHALRCGLLQESKRSTGADHSGVLLLHILVLSLQVLLRLLQALAFLAGVFELLLQRVDLILVDRLSRLQRACPSTGENAVAMTRLNRPVINGGTCWALARSIATFCMCALFC
jgi:hypothetical protein